MMKKTRPFVLLVIVFIFLFIWLLSKLDIWTVTNIKVENNTFVSYKSIIQTASTVNYGDNMLYYPSAKVRKQMLREIPQLKKVTIRKNIFSKTITFKVKEKEPFVNIIFYPNYYVVSEEGVLLNVDVSGNVFDIAEIMNLPMLIGIDEQLLVNQRSLPVEYTILLKNILRKFVRFFGKETLKLDVTSKKDIIIMTEDIFDIKVGDMERIDDKVRVFKRLFKILKDRKEDIMYIDVRYPDYPVVRYVR